MKVSRAVALLACLAAAAFSQDGAKAEGDRKLAEARGLYRKRRFDEARKRFEEAAALLERANVPAGAAFALGWAGKCRMRARDYPGAAEVFGDCVKRLRGLHGTADRPDVAALIGLQAECLVLAKRPKEALPVCRAAVAMRERLHGGDHRSLAKDLNSLGACLRGLEKATEAIPVHERALAMRERLFGADHALVAQSLHNLGHCLYYANRYAEAVARLEKALAIRDRVYPPAHPMIDSTLEGLCQALDTVGRHEDSLQVTRRLRRVREARFAAGHPRIAICDARIASLLVSLGRSSEALDVAQRALQACEKLGSGEVELLFQSHRCMADSLMHRWRFREALEVVDRLLASPHVAERVSVHAGALRMRASCLLMMGRPADAFAVYQRARALLRTIEPRPPTAILHHEIGQCLVALGRPAEAPDAFEKALALRRRFGLDDHPHQTGTLRELGAALSDLGRYDEGIATLRDALARRERRFGKKHQGVAYVLNDLAAAVRERDGPEAALPLYLRALKIKQKVFRETNETVARGLMSVALCYAQLKRYEDALPYARAAAEATRASGSPYHYVRATCLAWVQLGLGRKEQAIALLEEAAAQVETLRAHTRGLGTEERSAYAARLARIGLFDDLARSYGTSGRGEEALEALERGRARTLLDLLERGSGDPLDEAERRADAGTRTRIRNLRRRIEANLAEAGAATLDLAGDGPTRREARERLDAARREERVLRAEQAGLVRELVPMASPVSAADLRRHLGRKDALLYYAFHAHGGLLSVVAPGGAIDFVELAWPDGTKVDRETLAEAVGAYIGSLTREGRNARGVTRKREAKPTSAGQGRRLFHALIPPEVWKVLAGARRVVVVPHGALHRLPFEVLAVEPGRYWLDDGPPIVYAASASALRWSRARRDALKPGRDIVVVGDPAFAKTLEPLPGTRREATAIRGVMGEKTRVLLGPDATEAALFAAAPHARYLHLATHHLADETTGGSYSRLALAMPAAPKPGNDGFLTLRDLLEGWGGRLAGCELVVLAACDTQVGPTQRNEAPYSMPIGFLFAGCPSVIASLWRIDDESTADLMADFYARLEKGEGKLAAFAAARRAHRERRPHPYFWGPFVYIGDPR